MRTKYNERCQGSSPWWCTHSSLEEHEGTVFEDIRALGRFFFAHFRGCGVLCLKVRDERFGMELVFHIYSLPGLIGEKYILSSRFQNQLRPAVERR